MVIHSAAAFLLAAALLLTVGRSQAAEPRLVLEFGGTSHSLGRDALLANPAAPLSVPISTCR
jgi:hypothetical protein